MKKAITLFLCVIMILSLCACGKSEAAKVCEGLIERIGEVTLDSEEAIKLAEESYEALSDEEKDQIKKSGEVLTASRETYDQLYLHDRTDGVVELIEAIGDVTLDSEKAIKEAEKAYSSLTDEEKDFIKESGEKLEADRTAYDTMLMEQHAADVVDQINTIGEVTLDARSEIESISAAYAALTDAEKALVTNGTILEAAEAKLDELVQAEKQRIFDEYLPKFIVDEDKVEGITWYTPKNMPKYANERCYVVSYIGVQNNQVWLCNRFLYTGDSWVFYDKIIFSVDGETSEKNIGSFATKRDNGGGDVWEVYDEILPFYESMDAEEIQLLSAIADSQEAIIRFKGDAHSYDYTVTSTDKQMLHDTLALYKALIS